MIKKILLVLLLVILAVAGYVWYKFSSEKGGGFAGDKLTALTAKKHSAAFNKSVQDMLGSYFTLQLSLVEADTAQAKANGQKLKTALDSIHIEELQKDTAAIFETAKANLDDLKRNVSVLLTANNITDMRKGFSDMSEVLYPSFVNAINYEGAKMYWQNCPMAFDNKGANWLSNTYEIMNPYMGKKDVKHGNTMLHCGEVMDSVVTK